MIQLDASRQSFLSKSARLRDEELIQLCDPSGSAKCPGTFGNQADYLAWHQLHLGIDWTTAQSQVKFQYSTTTINL